MKKTTLKIAAFLFVAIFALQTNAQGQFWTKEGFYKISARGTDPALYMTADLVLGQLVWAEASDDAMKLQDWAIVNHRTPASAGLMEIYTVHPQAGTLTMCTTDALIEKDENGLSTENITLTFEAREPKSIEYSRVETGTDEEGNPTYKTTYSGDRSGLDQFQRRKALVDANGDATSKANGGANPAGIQNNALFIQISPTLTGSRFGVTPTAAGEAVKFDKGGIDVIDFVFVKDIEVASTTNFDASSLSISNPVNDRLIVRGINSDITKLSVYNLLGSKVLSKNLTGSSSVELSVSNLVSGMYIVKLEGANKAFSKKIIKQ